MSSRIVGAAVVAFVALAPASAFAQDRGPLEVDQAPEIIGDPYVGSTLTAGGGRWVSPNPEPSRTEAWWEWWSCNRTNPTSGNHCAFRTRNATYTVGESDRGRYMFLVRYVRWRDLRDEDEDDDDRWVYRFRLSAPAGPVTNAPPPPAATPAPTPAPATPTPAPTFDTAAATPTPVPTSGQVLRESATKRRAIRPFPVVRMRGRLTATGARVTILSVRAPRAAKVTVRCTGRCPRSRWSAAERKRRVTRVRAFERALRSGTRITVTVSRRGYIGKRTTFVIQRGRAPLRVDRCINTRGRTTRCP